MAENFFKEAGTFASDAAIDTAADGAINSVIDGVADHIPGGRALDAMAKTGIDLAANNAINAEVAKVEGAFGGHGDAEPATPADADTAGGDSQT